MRTVLTAVLVLGLMGCGDDDGAKRRGFDGPEEYLANPDIDRAVEESGMEVHLGETPPRLAGNYAVDGTVVDAHVDISHLRNTPLRSTFCFFNQTARNTIEFRESLQGISVSGQGGFISGSGGFFTTWQESDQEGETAGLPDGCSLHVAAMISGVKLDGGDLSAEGLSVITDTLGCPSSDVRVEGLWWRWEAPFRLLGDC